MVESVGAYCSAMSTAGYNSFPTAPEVSSTQQGRLRLYQKAVDGSTALLQNAVKHRSSATDARGRARCVTSTDRASCPAR